MLSIGDGQIEQYVEQRSASSITSLTDTILQEKKPSVNNDGSKKHNGGGFPI